GYLIRPSNFPPPHTGTYLIADPTKTSIATTSDFYSMNIGEVTGWTTTIVGGVPMDVPITQTTYSGSVNKGAYDVNMTPAFSSSSTYTITTHGTHGKEKTGLSVLINPTPGNNIGDYGMVGKVTLTAI